MQTVEALLQKLEESPQTIEFSEVMRVIDSCYRYTPTNFTCGNAESVAGSNEGSCKILAFGKQQGLSVDQTLALFGRYYREDVLNHPQADDHANIRNFIVCGWGGVSFDTEPLR